MWKHLVTFCAIVSSICWLKTVTTGKFVCEGGYSLLPSGSPFGDPGPHGDLFQFLGPQKVPIFFPRSPFSLFQAEERAKSQSSHCLLNVDHLNTSDDKTSLNEYHASEI